MVKLAKSEGLGRVIRQDDLAELGVSTWTKIKEAIRAGRTQEALDLVDYNLEEGRRGLMPDAFWALETHIANTLGEDALYKVLREMAEPFYRKLTKLTPIETVWLRAESERNHRAGPTGNGDVTVYEEADRYVLKMDPCGTGGRMRRQGRTEPPYNYGKTKKAQPWSWGKAGVPYYCAHCCIWSEILPIEWQGYPQRVTEYPDNPSDPCTFYIYKKPELIPEKYFTRIGKKKTIK